MRSATSRTVSTAADAASSSTRAKDRARTLAGRQPAGPARSAVNTATRSAPSIAGTSQAGPMLNRCGSSRSIAMASARVVASTRRRSAPTVARTVVTPAWRACGARLRCHQVLMVPSACAAAGDRIVAASVSEMSVHAAVSVRLISASRRPGWNAHDEPGPAVPSLGRGRHPDRPGQPLVTPLAVGADLARERHPRYHVARGGLQLQLPAGIEVGHAREAIGCRPGRPLSVRRGRCARARRCHCRSWFRPWPSWAAWPTWP